MIYSWEAKHTVINGHRLIFDGTALQLFGNWIKWFLLTIFTCGIYGIWVAKKLKQWKVYHTHAESGRYPYFGGYESYFDGGILEWILYSLLLGILVGCTVGVAFPIAYTIWIKWELKHTVIDGQRLMNDGAGLGLLLVWLLWMVLTVITFGIFGFWVHIKLMKWRVSHTFCEYIPGIEG